MKIGFIGLGRMGGALAGGAVAAGALKNSQVVVFDVDRASLEHARKSGFLVTRSVRDLIKSSQIVFLCVKPQSMAALLDEIVRSFSVEFLRRKCFVSIAAGVSLIRLEKALGRGVSMIRVMPNTPALLQAGMSGFSLGGGVKTRQSKFVAKILSSVGDAVLVPESLMHAVTAISGSGPAYVFYLAEALIEGAIKLGFTRDQARRFVHQTVYGAGLMLQKRAWPAAELRRQVTSPGGTTEAALAEFERGRFKPLVKRAVQQALQRSKFLSRKL